MIEEAGFIKVHAEDKTDNFVSVLTEELATFEREKDSFIKVPPAGCFASGSFCNFSGVMIGILC